MPELSAEQADWLKIVLFGKYAGTTASKQPRTLSGGAVSGTVSGALNGERAGSRPSLLGRVDDHFNRNPEPPGQASSSAPLTQAASDRLTGLGFGAPPPSAVHAGPAPKLGTGWVNAPMLGAKDRFRPAATGATPEPFPRPAPLPGTGQLFLDGIKDTLTDGSNPLPIDAGALLAQAVEDGGIGGELAGAAVGGVLAAGTTVAKDVDKVTSGKMTAADATADVVVEGATGAAAALVGAEAGAATGALLGSFVPGLGTAVGGAVGFLVGGVAGYAAGQAAHSGSTLNKAKEALGGALSGVERPLQAAWGVAADTVHAVGSVVTAVEDTAGQATDAMKDAASAVADAAGSLWDGLKNTDPSVMLQAA